MLTGLRLGNFKAFGETQRVPIRPLTLIFGANSSGKSSLIHGLLLARHAVDTGELDVHRTALGGDSVDLGGFRQYVHKRDPERRVDWGAEVDVTQLQGRTAELLSPAHRICVSLSIGIQDKLDALLASFPNRDRTLQHVLSLISYEIEADGISLLRMSWRHEGGLRLDRLDHHHPVFQGILKAIIQTATTTETLAKGDLEVLSETIAELVPEIAFHMGNLLPDGLVKTEKATTTGDPGDQPVFFPISRGRRKEDLAAAIRFFLPRILEELIQELTKTIAGELERFQYLGPLRSYPPRHLAFSQHHDPNWLAGGGYAWDVVRRDEEVRETVNTWLSSPERLQTPYELKIQELVSIEQLEEPLGAGLEDMWVEAENPFDTLTNDREGIAENLKGKVQGWPFIDKLKELVLIDRRSNTTVSHRDVGIGISQVLPVLVGAYGSKEKILAIEQPEIHLHPALQAELGDVFIESALGERKNTFLIETHSEHLILRLMRRMRDTFQGTLPEGLPPVRPQDVAILYVQSKDSSTVVRVLELDEEGQFLDPWPGGFFEEGFRERFS